MEVFEQGPAPTRYIGTRQWNQLTLEEQDRFLISCLSRNEEWYPVMVSIGLKFGTGQSLAMHLSDLSNEGDREVLRRRMLVRATQPGQAGLAARRLFRAVSRRDGASVIGPEPEIFPKQADDDLCSCGKPRLKPFAVCDTCSAKMMDEAKAAGERQRPWIKDGDEWPTTLAVIGVIVAVFPMPYGYYLLLRAVLCLLLGWLSFASGRNRWLLASIPLVVLYNPIVPVELGSKPLWTALNVATVPVIYQLNKLVSWRSRK